MDPIDDGDDSDAFEGHRPPGAGGEATHIEPDIITPDESQSVTARDGNTDQNSAGGSGTVPIESVDAAWAKYFPFDEPYSDQVDGINAFVDALAGYDNMVMEGACGTGKTLVGLTAGIHALRDSDVISERRDVDAPDYSRILAVTPVKQQLKQFIEEMQTINRNLDGVTPLKTIVMRGQGDVLPYAYVDYHPFNEYNVAAKIDDLRLKTIQLIRFDSDIPLDWPEEMDPPDYSKYAYNWGDPGEEAKEMRDAYKFDPNRAECVVRLLTNRVEAGEDPLVVDGVTAPYPDGIPHTNEMVDTERLQRTGSVQLPSDLQGKFDPFYAGFFAHDRLPFWFSDADQSVMESNALFRESVSHGVCPHQAMADMMEHADVLIGNYYHVFDPDTRLLTDMKTKVLDEETICVLDEAHNIEERVRSILSDSHGIYSFRHSVNDIRAALGYVNGDIGELPSSEQQEVTEDDMVTAKPKATQILESPVYGDVSDEAFRETMEFFNFLESWLTDESAAFLDDRFNNGWEWVVNNRPAWVTSEDIPLEEPESAGSDELSTVVNEYFDSDIWERAYTVSRASQQIIEEMPVSERVPECESMGEFFHKWANESHVDYFREIVLEASSKQQPLDESHEWTREWTPKYQLYNCIPTKKLREVFSELGSALLMSATLEPMQEFAETTGIERCVTPRDIEEKDERATAVRTGEADENDELAFRDVTVRQYPLRFPEENRLSMTVTAPKFTYSNRQAPTTDAGEMTDTRQLYANLLEEIARSRGNVLLCLPSYSEARWAVDVLRDAGVDSTKRVVLDQSSSSEETDENLQEFFGEESSVIVTSTRGTITEGVDYDGDKLHTCAVVGVSLLPPQDRNKAVEFAYDENLSGISGFDATNKIPAVRKARQAIGRVIRGTDEVGARIFIDERYAKSGWGGVKNYLSEQEQREFSDVRPEQAAQRLQRFWDVHD